MNLKLHLISIGGVGVGAAFAISPRSEFFGEITYHESHPSWTYDDKNIIIQMEF